MLKFAKHVLLILGAILVVAAASWLLYEFVLSGYSLKNLVHAPMNDSTAVGHYTTMEMGILLSAVIALIGGFILGLGLGIPSATFKQRYEQRQADAAKKLGEAAADDAPATDAAEPAKA